MTRTVRAILIAGDEDLGTPAPGALEALAALDADLVKRFPVRDVARLQNGPTRSKVLDAFATMRSRLSLGELFIVMFAGHGDKATSDQPSQLWDLTDDEQFDDGELAEQLLALPDGVDIVVVSDCCYGAGFFTPGPERLARGASGHHVRRRTIAAGRTYRPILTDAERQALTKQSQALGTVLLRRFKARAKDSPMVCISAASKDSEVDIAELPILARRTADAADRRVTYGMLKEEFKAQAPTDAAFQVDARPPNRLSDRVLGV